VREGVFRHVFPVKKGEISVFVFADHDVAEIPTRLLTKYVSTESPRPELIVISGR
jgi:hypothetical protein